MIRTVTGDIRCRDLGFCQPHEHLLISYGQSARINPALCIDDPNMSLEEVKRYREAGGRSLVEAQPTGCGRMAEGLLGISKKSGINIIASTGFHLLKFYPRHHWIYGISSEEMLALLLRELQEGMYLDGNEEKPAKICSAKAGIIKCALDVPERWSRYAPLFTAAAAACRMTGAPMLIHVEKNSDPRTLAEFLQAEGVSFDRMIFCHMDRAVPDLALHDALCARGAYLEYDTVGRYKYHDDATETDIIRGRIENGHVSRLMVSLDTTRERMTAYGGAPGLDFILRRFCTVLRNAGRSDAEIQAMTVENPRCALAWKQGS